MNAENPTAESGLTHVSSPVVAQTFLSAGSGDFPVPSSRTPRRPTELESSVNPQAGKPALQAARTSQRDVLTRPNTYTWSARLPRLKGRADPLRFGMARRASRLSLTP